MRLLLPLVVKKRWVSLKVISTIIVLITPTYCFGSPFINEDEPGLREVGIFGTNPTCIFVSWGAVHKQLPQRPVTALEIMGWRLSTRVFLRTPWDDIIVQARTRASAKHQVLAPEGFGSWQDRILQGI